MQDKTGADGVEKVRQGQALSRSKEGRAPRLVVRTSWRDPQATWLPCPRASVRVGGGLGGES